MPVCTDPATVGPAMTSNVGLGIVIEVIYVGLRLQGRVLGNVVDNDTILQNRCCFENEGHGCNVP